MCGAVGVAPRVPIAGVRPALKLQADVPARWNRVAVAALGDCGDRGQPSAPAYADGPVCVQVRAGALRHDSSPASLVIVSCPV